MCQNPSSYGTSIPEPHRQVCERVKNCSSACFSTDSILEKEMATHSSIFAWRIPWTEETGGLQSMGSQRVRPD